MAIAMYHSAAAASPAEYDEVMRRLQAAGQGAPAGRLHHYAFVADDGSFRVFDIWESREAFQAFAEILGPILAEVGTDSGPPEFGDVHNIVEG